MNAATNNNPMASTANPQTVDASAGDDIVHTAGDRPSDEASEERVPADGNLIADQSPNESAPRFLRLPSEIRLHVYAYLFKLGTPVHPQLNGLPGECKTRSGFDNGVVLAMTCANKQLAREVTDFIYTNNCFSLTLAYHRDWVTRIGHKNSTALKDVILVGGGRPDKAAGQLSAMLATLWKRAPSLYQITFQDTWGSLDSAFIVRQLLAVEMDRPWRTFHDLQRIQIDIPHKVAPIFDKPLYDRLCTLTKTSITARYDVKGGKAPLTWGLEGWRSPGTVWLQVSCK